MTSNSDEISNEQATFLEFMIPMNIEARYPKYKSSVSNTLNNVLIEPVLMEQDEPSPLYRKVMRTGVAV